MKMNIRSASFGVVVVLLASVTALADPARDAIVAALSEEAKKQDAGFTGFSAERGQAFWMATHPGGKPDTPSCTSCHGPDPTQAGQTRAGKAIEPMAVSKASTRLTDPAEVNKWFTRNCSSVLGRECTAVEKGDVIAYLLSK
jgi:hypothetical protein